MMARLMFGVWLAIIVSITPACAQTAEDGAITNSLLYSQVFSNGVWTAYSSLSASAAPGINDPYGGNTAYEATFGTDPGSEFYQSLSSFTVGQIAWTSLSCMAVSTTTTIRFGYFGSWGHSDSIALTCVPGIWSRIIYPFVLPGTLTNFGLENNAAGNSAPIYFAAFQISKPSSYQYVPTTNAARTVAAINATSSVGTIGGPPQ